MSGTQTKVSVSKRSGNKPRGFQVHELGTVRDIIPSKDTEVTDDTETVDAYVSSYVVDLPRRIGYERVSTTDQDTALQHAALLAAGCTLIYSEKMSGTKTSRPALDACLKELKPGDTLVVWKLDRLGRTMLQLLSLAEEFGTRDIAFVCTTQGMDTSTTLGKLMLGVLAAFAEFERNTIVERTYAGMAAAREKGHFGGRRRKLTGDTLARAVEAYHNRPTDPATGRPMTNDQLASMFGISKPTLQRWALHNGVPTWGPQREAFIKRNPDVDAWREKTNDPHWGDNPDKRSA
jgi:DNA invertase Pin-like site-specific DNA recombinase